MAGCAGMNDCRVPGHRKPRSNGRTVAPSGRFPSSRVRPTGSSTLTTPASARAALILEFTSEWRACLPMPLWQVRAWSPSSSSRAPQSHLPGVATGRPSCSPTATCSAASDSRMPSRELGRARIKEADSEVAHARNRAISACPGNFGYIAPSRYRSSGPLHAELLKAVASVGGSAPDKARNLSIASIRTGSGSEPHSSSASSAVAAVDNRKTGRAAWPADSNPIPPSVG